MQLAQKLIESLNEANRRLLPADYPTTNSQKARLQKGAERMQAAGVEFTEDVLSDLASGTLEDGNDSEVLYAKFDGFEEVNLTLNEIFSNYFYG